MPADPIHAFLSIADGNWSANLPVTNQWIVAIYTFPQVIKNNIVNLDGLVQSDWSIGIPFDKLTRGNMQQNPAIGCFFAQTCSQVAESHGSTVANIENNGGMIPGIVSEGRSDFNSRKLKIVFRETNLSFIDMVVRPWVILTSHLGRIADDDSRNLKTHIQTIHFTRGEGSGGTARPIRKIFNYYGCTPISVEARESNYELETFDKVLHATEWIYDNYSVQADFVGN